MTEPGWRPDPFGRAGRRYHDGQRWTEHVADDMGNTAVDQPGERDPAGPVTSPIIGAPPPRQRPSPAGATGETAGTGPPPTSPAPRPDLVKAHPAPERPSPADRTPAPAPPALADEVTGPMPPSGSLPSERTGRVPLSDEATTVVPADVAAAAARGDLSGQITYTGSHPAATPDPGHPGPTPDATSVIDLRALGPLPTGAPATGPATGTVGPLGPERGSTAGHAAPPDGGSVRRAFSPIGLAFALVGLALAAVGVFVLGWVEGDDPLLSDLRNLISRTGPDIGPAPVSLILAGAWFSLVAGALVGLGRAIGARPVAVAAAVLLITGATGLGLLTAGATSVDDADLPSASVTVPEGRDDMGTPVTDPATGAAPTVPGGAPVTDPLTQAPPTVPTAGPTSDELRDELDSAVAAERSAAQRSLRGGGIVAGALMFLITVLGAVGLLRDGAAGRLFAAASLLVTTGWAAAGTFLLGQADGVTSLGPGPWLLVAGLVLIAVGTLVPGRKTRIASAN